MPSSQPVTKKAKIRHFPSHGLRYSGKASDNSETLYKKELDLLVQEGRKDDDAIKKFNDFLSFELGGMADILRADILRDKASAEEEKDIKNIIKTNFKIQKKIYDLIEKIGEAETKDLIKGVCSGAKEQYQFDLNYFLNKFNKKNESRIENAPTVFYKYALQSELVLLSKQFQILANKKHAKFDSSKMISFIESMRDKGDMKNRSALKFAKYPLQPLYNSRVEAALNAATEQFKTILEGGSMSIALKDPATRKFKSILDNSIIIDGIISESQFDVIRSLEEKIEKSGELVDGIKFRGGKVKVRMPTGAGKTYLVENLIPSLFMEAKKDDISVVSGVSAEQKGAGSKVAPIKSGGSRVNELTPIKKKVKLPHRFINLDLNSLEIDSKAFEEEKNLSGVIVLMDEEYFYYRHYLKTHDKLDIVAIETEKNNFIAKLQGKGALVLTLGASESLARIQYEIDRTKEKISEEQRSTIEISNKQFIDEANKFIFMPRSKSDGDAKTTFFQEVVNYRNGDSRNIVTKKDGTISYRCWSDNIKIKSGARELALLIDSDGNPFSKSDKDNITLKQFLVRTAFYIEKLGSLTREKNNGDSMNRALDKIKLHLTTVEGIEDKKYDLKYLLKNDRIGKIEPIKLFEAVEEFVKNSEFTLLNSSSNPMVNPRGSVARVARLQAKLETRQFEYDDLKHRRDILTPNRFDKSEIITTPSYNVEAPSKDSQDHLGDPSDLFTIVKGFLKNQITPLKDGEKMQYILPDFDINDKTCGEKGLREIINSGAADIVIIPHKEEGKKLRFRIAYAGSVIDDERFCGYETFDNVNEGLKFMQQEVGSKIPNPRIISFFDIKNSIGGDYGTASVNIAKQYIHLTKPDCLDYKKNLHALTWNQMMQFNRNRTDPDSIDYDSLDLKFILPAEAFVDKKLNYVEAVTVESKFSTKLHEAIKEVITRNTAIDDKNHLRGIVESKLDRNPGGKNNLKSILEALDDTKESELATSKEELQKKNSEKFETKEEVHAENQKLLALFEAQQKILSNLEETAKELPRDANASLATPLETKNDKIELLEEKNAALPKELERRQLILSTELESKDCELRKKEDLHGKEIEAEKVRDNALKDKKVAEERAILIEKQKAEEADLIKKQLFKEEESKNIAFKAVNDKKIERLNATNKKGLALERENKALTALRDAEQDRDKALNDVDEIRIKINNHNFAIQQAGSEINEERRLKLEAEGRETTATLDAANKERLRIDAERLKTTEENAKRDVLVKLTASEGNLKSSSHKLSIARSQIDKDLKDIEILQRRLEKQSSKEEERKKLESKLAEQSEKFEAEEGEKRIEDKEKLTNLQKQLESVKSELESEALRVNEESSSRQEAEVEDQKQSFLAEMLIKGDELIQQQNRSREEINDLKREHDLRIQKLQSEVDAANAESRHRQDLLDARALDEATIKLEINDANLARRQAEKERNNEERLKTTEENAKRDALVKLTASEGNLKSSSYEVSVARLQRDKALEDIEILQRRLEKQSSAPEHKIIREFEKTFKPNYKKASDLLFGDKTEEEKNIEIDYYRNHRHRIYQDDDTKPAHTKIDLSEASDEEIIGEIAKDRERAVRNSLPKLVAKLIGKKNNEYVIENLSLADIAIALSVGNSEEFDQWKKDNPDTNIGATFSGKLEKGSKAQKIRSKAIDNLLEGIKSYAAFFGVDDSKVLKPDMKPNTSPQCATTDPLSEKFKSRS